MLSIDEFAGDVGELWLAAKDVGDVLVLMFLELERPCYRR